MDLALDTTFAALADPTRRAIITRLSTGPAPVGDLVALFKMSWPAITKHLKVLERAHLVARERKGRTHLISLEAGTLSRAHEWLSAYQSYWEDQFDRLETYLDQSVEETS